MCVGVIQVVSCIITLFFCTAESYSFVGRHLPLLLLMDVWDVEQVFITYFYCLGHRIF